jgi:hypothetical protein
MRGFNNQCTTALVRQLHGAMRSYGRSVAGRRGPELHWRIRGFIAWNAAVTAIPVELRREGRGPPVPGLEGLQLHHRWVVLAARGSGVRRFGNDEAQVETFQAGIAAYLEGPAATSRVRPHSENRGVAAYQIFEEVHPLSLASVDKGTDFGARENAGHSVGP